MPPTRRRDGRGSRTQVSQENPEEAMRLRSGRIINTVIIHQHWEFEETAQATDTESLEVNNELEIEEGQGQETATVSIDEIEVQAPETDTESIDEINDVQEVWAQDSNIEASDEINDIHENQEQENDTEIIEEIISVNDDEEIQMLQNSENVVPDILTENLNNETIDLTNSPARPSFSPPAIIRRPSQSWFPWRLPSITRLWPFSAVGGGNPTPDQSAVSAVPTSAGSTDAVKCPLCFETLADLGRSDQIVATKCGHVYCRACLKAALRVKPQCPICRKNIRVFGYHPIYLF